MISKGTLVIINDHELKETYVGELLEDFEEHRSTSPAVRIRWMLVYPRQTAIMHHDIITENAPLPEGTQTRMSYVCSWPLPSLPEGSYQDSVARALMDYAREAQADGRQDILAILERHRQGDYQRKRRIAPVKRL